MTTLSHPLDRVPVVGRPCLRFNPSTGLWLCSHCGKEKPPEAYNGEPVRAAYCRECSQAVAREKYWADGHAPRRVGPDPASVARKHRKHQLKKRYGLTPDQFDAMVQARSDHCDVCGAQGKAQLHGHLYVDHDHTTDVVRGLLCNRCNIVLGELRDDPALLHAMVSYLQERLF